MIGSEQVYLDRCKTYKIEGINTFLDKVSGVFRLPTLKGVKVLLKPNLISIRGNFSCTHPHIIIGVATWLINHGARVFVGDSPAFGSAASVLKKLGLLETLSKLGVGIIEFKKGKSVTLANGAKIVMATELLEYDLLVNLPKIKAHDQLFITMAVKNFFGVIIGLQKAKLHMTQGHSASDFASILLDLLPLLPPNVSIADGIDVMHCHGPLNGELLRLGILGACTNPLALDTALLALLELDPVNSPVHHLAQKRKMKGATLSELSFPILQPSFFTKTGFIAPDNLDPVRFHPMRYSLSLVKRVLLKRFT